MLEINYIYDYYGELYELRCETFFGICMSSMQETQPLTYTCAHTRTTTKNENKDGYMYMYCLIFRVVVDTTTHRLALYGWYRVGLFALEDWLSEARLAAPLQYQRMCFSHWQSNVGEPSVHAKPSVFRLRQTIKGGCRRLKIKQTSI